MPNQAAAVAGDTVAIAPGIYEGEVSTWKANGLVLRGYDYRPSAASPLIDKGVAPAPAAPRSAGSVFQKR